MRFIQPEPKQAAREIASEAYTLHTTVNDVTTVLKDRLSSQIERYFRGAAQHFIIAMSLTEAAAFDLACAIRYPRAFKKQDLKQHLKFRIILQCFRRVLGPSCFGAAVAAPPRPPPRSF